jgi:hypothetical protein
MPDYAALAKKHGGVVASKNNTRADSGKKKDAKGRMSKPPTKADKAEETSELPDFSDVPQFIRKNIDLSKVKQVVTPKYDAAGKNIVADVDTDKPYKINVDEPDIYGPPILNHELTHTVQGTRNKNLPAAKVNTVGGGKDRYDYGGLKGLQAALKSGKTIADFNEEQQAEMVKNYKEEHDSYLAKAAAGKLTEADKKAMYDLQQAYHPFIRQLADMPGESEKLDQNPLKMLLGQQAAPTINMKPDAPGLPDYSVPGLNVLPADPLMGGYSQPTTKRK